MANMTLLLQWRPGADLIQFYSVDTGLSGSDPIQHPNYMTDGFSSSHANQEISDYRLAMHPFSLTDI